MSRKIVLLVSLCAAHAFAQSGGLVNATRGYPQPNDGTTGTTLFGTAIVNSSGNAINATTSNTTVTAYIVIGGAGVTGNAVLASQGTLAPCTMDSTIASGAGADFVIVSTTNAHQCHAQSALPGAGVYSIGFLAQQSTTSGSTALVSINGFIPSTVAGGGNVTQNTVAVPELAINGTNIVTGNSFTWTKTNEPTNFAWLGPTYGTIPNIIQWQHSFCQDGTGQNTCTVKFASNPNNLSAVLLFLNTGSTSTMNNGGSVTDTLLNTYVEVAHNGGTGGGVPPYIFAACGITGGAPDTLTFIAAAGGSVILNLEAVEIFGAPATNCFDQSGFSTSSLSVSTAGSVAQASEQIVAMFTNNDTTQPLVTFSAGTGYTLFDQDQGCTPSCSSAHQTLMSEAGNATTGLSGTQTATATVSGTTTNVGGVIATVKLTTTGGAPPTFKPIVIQDLPVSTFTPTSGDCVSWLLVNFTNYELNDAGGPCTFLPTYNNAGTQATGVHIVTFVGTLSGGTLTVAFSGAAAYTSSSTYQCFAGDTTTPTNSVVVSAYTSGSSVTFGGTGSDTFRYFCIGN